MMSIIFLIFICLGHSLFIFGINLSNFYLIVSGRFLFGIGGESLNISLTTIFIKWFQGNELSFAQVLLNYI
jgi:hypothetical protein